MPLDYSKTSANYSERMNISIIIPTLNEREQLPLTIAAIRRASVEIEIIVADANSSDGTREWLSMQPDITVINSERGRGQQQNTGAKIASGEIFLFVHADCLLPNNFAALIEAALKNPAVAGGAFLIRFDTDNSRSLQIISKGINARTRVTKTATGDQAIFVQREIFAAIGGFENWLLFEDVRLVSEIKRRGEFNIINETVIIAARRYLTFGPWRTTFLMYALRIGYWLGVHPDKLYQWFNDVR